MLEGGVALLRTEALLADIGLRFTEKQLVSDSTAALSVSEGSCSWRTRHLRIRAQWLYEQVTTGKINVVHCRDEPLVADMLTKPMSSARMAMLFRLWNMRASDPAAAEQQATPAAAVVGPWPIPS